MSGSTKSLSARAIRLLQGVNEVVIDNVDAPLGQSHASLRVLTAAAATIFALSGFGVSLSEHFLCPPSKRSESDGFYLADILFLLLCVCLCVLQSSTVCVPPTTHQLSPSPHPSPSPNPFAFPNLLPPYIPITLEDLKQQSILAHNLWKSVGSPRSGDSFNFIRDAKYKYKLAIRDAASQFESRFDDDLLVSYLDKD